LRSLLVGVAILAPFVAHAAVEDDLRDGDKHFEDGDWQRAATAFDRAIAKAPSQVTAEAYGKRAAIFIIQKDYKGGLAFIEKAKLRYPSAPEIMEQEALMLYETDQKTAAVAVAEKVVAAKPGAFTNQKLIGEYYATRDPLKTARAFEAYLASRPGELEQGDVLPRIRLGFAYLANAKAVLGDGDDARAATYYTKAIEQFDTVQKKFGKKPNAQTNADNGLCAAYTGLGRYDQAVTVCERIVADPKKIDASGSVWWNLGTAYLARKQTQKARAAATEFTRMRKTEARGYILLGDTHYDERQWSPALDQFLRAEKLLKPTQTRDQVQLSIRLGKTYRRLPVAAGAKNPNLDLAIDKLSTAFAANPNSLELAIELAGAHLEARQDAKAIALVERVLGDGDTQRAPVEQRAQLYVLAGKGHFNTKKLKESRARFEAAQKLRPADVTIQRGLVYVINEQAQEAVKDEKASQALLDQALAIDPSSPVTMTNIAVLAISRGDCSDAQRHLAKLESISGHDAVLRTRLSARAMQCLAKPDLKKASELYASAETLAKKAGATLAQAEIYAEWGPLLFDTDLSGAVEKLDFAVQAGAGEPRISQPARRNLALALYRRGWKSLREGKGTEALADLERAFRDVSVLKGTEPLAFEFSVALAQLDAGRAAEAGRTFRALGGKGNLASYLKPPYARVGPQLLAAYASYRTGTLAARQQAAADFARLAPDMPGAKIQELMAACWESIAFEQWRNGQIGAAGKSLATAETHASKSPDLEKRIRLGRLALALDKKQLSALEGLNGTPPEALVNLGIVYEQLGRPKDAYDAWVRAKARGVQTRDLQKWIDAKKRIYGY